jgi:predicted RNase H-like nuclease
MVRAKGHYIPGHVSAHHDPRMKNMPNPAIQFNTFIGVDGCRAGWFFVAIGPGNKTRFGLMKKIAEICEIKSDKTLFLVDIPIGLPSSTHPNRSCDLEARKLLSPLRHSSVFPPPCREALAAESYEEACHINRDIVGRMISQQAYHIGQKIREMDELLQKRSELRPFIREIHPEICFHSMADGFPMQHKKRSEEGYAERFTLIKAHFSDAETVLNSALERYLRREVKRDDILDAMAAAVIGKISKGFLQTLPKNPEIDQTGLPMEIVRIDPD